MNVTGVGNDGCFVRLLCGLVCLLCGLLRLLTPRHQAVALDGISDAQCGATVVLWGG